MMEKTALSTSNQNRFALTLSDKLRAVAAIAVVLMILPHQSNATMIYYKAGTAKERIAKRELVEAKTAKLRAETERIKAETAKLQAQTERLNSEKVAQKEGLKAYKKKDYKTAMTILMREAERGNGTAQSYVGQMYLDGKGVKKNREEAVYWITRAAQNDVPSCQRFLGQIYAKGQDVEQDMKEAIRWFQRAAKAGDEYSKEFLKKYSEIKKKNTG